MTPEQGRAAAALLMISRLISHHGLTMQQAAHAVAQVSYRETGEHTHLVTAEAAAMLAELMAPVRAFMDAMRPAVAAAAEQFAALARQLTAAAPTAAGRRTDRPAWASPYGPPSRRR
ncbi:hypothetical protein ACFY0G_02215 [Streptomyces sp. NPDC001552]|uniref:hypothetical protein n=1 Tax=Streptomyces sp. NPDC001552 TaxID=3364587 RepID=UPI003675D25A